MLQQQVTQLRILPTVTHKKLHILVILPTVSYAVTNYTINHKRGAISGAYPNLNLNHNLLLEHTLLSHLYSSPL